MYDRTGGWAAKDVTITAEPFAGQTYYVAANGSDSNDGTSMATPVLTLRHALLDLARPNTRVLFRRGDTFTPLFDVQTLSDWRSATGNDVNSLIQDPAFLSLDPAAAGFAKPSPTSPVVGKGVSLGAALDFHGNLRGPTPDIGAVQH